MHLQIETTGDAQLCCVAHASQGSPGNVHSESITRMFESTYINAVRRQMLDGTWPADCSACRDREALGLQSFRQSSNGHNPELFEKLVEKAPPAPRVRSLDLRLNNICNFKCRFCYGFNSNRWFHEHNLVFPGNPMTQKYQGFDRLPSFWDDFDRNLIHDLDTIHLAGGEPLLMDAHYRLLEKLIAAGRTGVKLQYDTNLSRLKFKHWDVLELWKQFPHVELSMSLDGVGPKGEYIREGLHYETWLDNARRVGREVPHVSRRLHFVVCILNVIDFPEHFKAIAAAHVVEPGWMTLTFLNWPAYLNVQVLTPELKRKAERNLRELLSSGLEIAPATRSQIHALIEFLNAADLSEEYRNEFAERTRILDRARGQNAAELFPDLAPMLTAPSSPFVIVNG